jgi:hypothetical protein
MRGKNERVKNKLFLMSLDFLLLFIRCFFSFKGAHESPSHNPNTDLIKQKVGKE